MSVEPAPKERSQAGSRRACLQEATRSMHAELDAHIDAKDLVHFEGYRRFLLASATGLFHLESLLLTSNIESLVPDWQQRRRSGLLHTDLIALDAFPPQTDAHSTQLDDAAMMGVLYVLEGSRLGARVLLSLVKNSEDARVRSTTRYLAANDVRLWQSFLVRLEEARESADSTRLIAGARYGFEVFQRAFQGNSGSSPLPSLGAA